MIPSEETRMDAQFEALAAWVDGEPVARTDVALALETREGRDYVLDLMALRHMVDVTTPALLPPGAASFSRPRSQGVRRWPAFAAAAAVVLCAAGGFAAGRLGAPVQVAAPAGPQTSVVPVVTPASITAPAPTRVIRLQEDTSWRESGGS
ncbi:MAG TPA: hypothetical protein VMZ90_10145 [Vicinamibacterales bacterium]|nr:hypothetical protein [Vicinamibacterales bacterium]